MNNRKPGRKSIGLPYGSIPQKAIEPLPLQTTASNLKNIVKTPKKNVTVSINTCLKVQQVTKPQPEEIYLESPSLVPQKQITLSVVTPVPLEISESNNLDVSPIYQNFQIIPELESKSQGTEIVLNIGNNEPIYNQNLQSGNFRSEGRWERGVLESLLSSIWVDKVYSLLPVWRAKTSIPRKFIDGLPKEKTQDCIGIFYDHSPHIARQYKFQALMLNVTVHRSVPQLWGRVGGFQGPDDLVNQWRQEYGPRFFLTSGYFTQQDYIEVMKRIIGEDIYEFLPIPNLPYVDKETQPFNNNIILWPNRDFLTSIIRGKIVTQENQRPFQWVIKKLKENLKLEFHVLTSEEEGPYTFHQCLDIYKELYSSPITKCLEPFKKRVKLHLTLDWNEAFKLWKNVKLPLSSITGFYNTAIEAAGHGVPTILFAPPDKAEGFLCANYFADNYFQLLDRLYYDEDFYIQQSTLYRDFAERHHTFNAFSKNLYEIFLKRGIVTL